MNLQERKALLVALGAYMDAPENEEWNAARRKAANTNLWFTPQFIDLATKNVSHAFLQPDALQEMIETYRISEPVIPKVVGIVMAGNIPLVGFHDLLCTFLCGHRAHIKASSKDDVLITHLVKKLNDFAPSAAGYFTISDMLKGCDAYIATGSNNSAAVFEHYFAKYPHIIRKNRTSVAVLTGKETDDELDRLADDVYLFFGLGCRNVTKLYVPPGYNFERLLSAFRKYNYLADHPKYRNNYDYNLAIALLDRKPYMSNESLLLIEDEALFSPISQLNFSYYDDEKKLREDLQQSADIQCVVSHANLGFGKAQQPAICDFADGINTITFLQSL